MSFRNFLACNRSCFLFLDPSINYTGYSVYQCSVEVGRDVKIELKKFGLIESDDADDRENHRRIRDITTTVCAICQENKVKYCYVEEPPPTVFNQKAKMDILMARAKSVAQTMAACHSFITAIESLRLARCRIYWPSDWQVHAKKRKDKSKIWSLGHANMLLKQYGFNRDLHTKKDENIADAINFGYFILSKFNLEILPFEL